MESRHTQASCRNEPALLLVTALQAEASPLIDHFRLKSLSNGPYSLFGNQNLSLVVTGVGELAAATATAAALSTMNKQSVTLNIGVAGADQTLGEIFYASAIEKSDLPGNQDTQSTNPVSTGSTVFYPHPPFRPHLPSIRVESVTQPSTNYQAGTCFDMEAYGFCFAARRFLDSERIHSLKIVSDNPGSPLDPAISDNKKLRKQFADNARELITEKVPDIEQFALELSKACGTQSIVADPSGSIDRKQEETLDQLLKTLGTDTQAPLHFSVSERQQLNRLAERYDALGRELPDQLEHSPLKTAREVIQLLTQEIDQHLPAYPAGTSAQEAHDKVAG